MENINKILENSDISGPKEIMIKNELDLVDRILETRYNRSEPFDKIYIRNVENLCKEQLDLLDVIRLPSWMRDQMELLLTNFLKEIDTHKKDTKKIRDKYDN